MSDKPRVEIYTKTDCPYCEKAKDLFDSKGVEYVTYNVTDDEERFAEMKERAEGRETAPEVFIDDELVGGWDQTYELEQSGALDEKLGLATDGGDQDEVEEHRKLIIAGTGIAALTAGIYAGRADNDPLMFEGDEPGGQLTLTTEVENYPGFPEGLSGPDLINKMKEQAQRFGAEIEHGVVTNVERVESSAATDQTASRSDDPASRPFRVELSNGDAYTTDALIAASSPARTTSWDTACPRARPATARSSGTRR